MTPSTVCIKAIRACVVTAAAAGMAPREVAQLLGVEESLFAEPHARVPHALLVRAWEELPRRLVDEAFGLHAAEAVRAARFDVIDYVVAQHATLRDALAWMQRFQRLHHDEAEVELVTQGDEARIALRIGAATPRCFWEFVVGTWVLRASSLAVTPFVPRLVLFQHGPPASMTEHRRVLGAPVAFHAEHNGLALAASHLATPLRSPDPALRAVLERHAAELLEKLPPRNDPTSAVRSYIVRQLPSEVPPLEATARALGTSVRSLQRTLRNAGTTYQAIVDETRRDLSISYLGERERTISEIAFLLGFVEVGAFSRAFRRWTGLAPVDYRRQAATTAP